MDEVITCKCGNQQWTIGALGIRCKNCGFWLTDWLTDKEYLRFIKIDVRAINELIESLTKHYDFEKKEPYQYQFEAGDVVIKPGGERRIIVSIEGELASITCDGREVVSSQTNFRGYGYKKIGVLADFIK